MAKERLIRRLAAAAIAAASLAVCVNARAGPVVVSTETGAGTLRWGPSTPEDLFSYERVAAGWTPTSWLTATALAMVLRERLSGTAFVPGTTWLFGGGAEIRPTEALFVDFVSAGAPTSTGPDGSRRWLATGGLSVGYEGIVSGPFVTGLELTAAYARLGFVEGSGPAPDIGQWSLGGKVTETVDLHTDLSLTVTGYLYDGDTALLDQAAARFGAARGAGLAPYRFAVRPEIERASSCLSVRAYWEVDDLIHGAGHELRAGAEIEPAPGAVLTPTLGGEAGVRVTGAGVVPLATVWVGARLALGAGPGSG